MLFVNSIGKSLIMIAATLLSLSLLAQPVNKPIDSIPFPKEVRNINNHVFKVGEELKYILHYGIINAGEATLRVEQTDHKGIADRNVVRVVGIGKSIGAFNWFFKVRDRYESYIDEKGAFPLAFVRRVNEGGYKINQDYIFHPKKKLVDNGSGKTFYTPAYVQDMFSAFYYARTLDMQNAEVGQIFTIESFVDDELFPLKIKYIGKDVVEGKAGKFNCLKFVPVVQKGRIFKDEEDLVVYVTDDKNKIPVLAQASVLVGSIKMELTDYKGLANPIALVKD